MTQASHAKPAHTPPPTPTTSLGAAAAAAATGSASKPDDKPAIPVTPSTPSNGTAPDEGKKARHGSKVFIAAGLVIEFDTVAKAEKYLNGPDAPTEYSVLRGKRIGTSKKVSLR